MKCGALVFMALLVAGPASAAGQQGGQEVEVGKYHLELVVKERDLTLYVKDQTDKPIAAKAVKAHATVLSATDKAKVDLAPAEGGTLKGQVPFAIRQNAGSLSPSAWEAGKTNRPGLPWVKSRTTKVTLTKPLPGEASRR